MSYLGVPQPYWDLHCKGGWQNVEIQGAPLVNWAPHDSIQSSTIIQDIYILYINQHTPLVLYQITQIRDHPKV